MTILAKEKTNISVNALEKISNTDLADLCYNAEQAIKAGGGFGWLNIPPVESLKKYWNGIVLIKSNFLVVGRLNGNIAGASQIAFNPPNNEAQKNISEIQSHFVAPWARGYGLAKSMIDYAVNTSKEIFISIARFTLVQPDTERRYKAIPCYFSPSMIILVNAKESLHFGC